MIILGKYSGRTGNHLFNYWVRYLYSKNKNLYLPPANIAWFSNTFNALNYEYKKSDNIVRYKKTRIFESPEIVFSDFDKIDSASDINIDQNLGFNYSQWIEPWIEEIRQLYQYEEPIIDIDYDNTLIINIRIGDFVRHKKVIDMSFYKKYIDNDNRKKLIITDEPNHEYIKNLNSTVFHEADPKKHFTILKNAKHVIGSNSTFFFWAMYLNSNIQKCIWPITTNGSYAAFSLTKIIKHNMDMRVDSSSFHYVYNVPYFREGDNNDWGMLKSGINNIEKFHKRSTYEVLQ